MSIPTIAISVLKYFHSFDLSAAAKTRDGRVIATRDPAGMHEAWWGKACDVGLVVQRAAANSGDVPKAARQLKIKLVEHTQALQRTEQLVARLDAKVAQAQGEGELKAFNRAFREHRLARFKLGKPSMNYATARSRLRAELAAVASGKSPPSGIIARVFEDRLPEPR
jgi:hypothetical protein